MGLPHGPQPGKIEESIGAKKTNELAVMIDTFKSLNMTDAALDLDDKEYPYSWIKSLFLILQTTPFRTLINS